MKLAVCDDDGRVLDFFKRILTSQQYAGTVEWSAYSSAGELLEACRSNCFDIIFMDIMLGDDSGIQTAEKAAGLNPGVRVVFITAHLPGFAEKIFGGVGQGVRPYGYIGKPLDAGKVRTYIEWARRELDSDARFLTVSRRGVDYQLSLSAVWYIESRGRKAFIHCGEEVIEVYDRLDNLWEQLDERFVRCHQSFIANLDMVTAMEEEAFVMDHGGAAVEIRISRNRMKETRQKYFEYKGKAFI